MKTKIKATLLHFLVSALLIFFCVGLTILHFYPSVFFDIESPTDALKILIPADIILGPLLTFIIYKKNKPGLKFDLVAIALCQIIGLSYGCWNIYSARPGFLVFHGDTFYIAPPSIDQTPLADTPLAVGKMASPKIVYLSLPGDVTNHFVVTVKSINQGIPIQWRSQYFKDFNVISGETLKRESLSIDALKKRSTPETLERLDKISQSSGKYAFFPVVGTRTSKVIAINISTKKAEFSLDIFPF